MVSYIGLDADAYLPLVVCRSAELIYNGSNHNLVFRIFQLCILLSDFNVNVVTLEIEIPSVSSLSCFIAF